MDSTVFGPAAEAEAPPGRWPLRENVFADTGELAFTEPEDMSWGGGESEPAAQEIGGLAGEGHQTGGYEPELEGYGSLAEDHELQANPADGWGHEGWDHEGQGRLVPCDPHTGCLCVPRARVLAGHRGPRPDLILRWNVSSVPEVIDVVVHLHGYWYAGMTLRENIEPVSGLDLTPVKGSTGQGRSRPTLTVLPKGNDTGRKQKVRQKDGSLTDGPYNVFTFPGLTTPDGLTRLIDFSLGSFAAQLGGVAPRAGRLILTAHSGGGAALLQILKYCNPHQIHIFDALYQDAEPLAKWARCRIRQDHAELHAPGAPSLREYMSTRGGALRVFYQDRVKTGTRCSSLKLREEISSGLTPELAPWYRVEASTYKHFEIPQYYGWRILAGASADGPGAYTEPVTDCRQAPRTATSKRRSSGLAELELGAAEFASEDLAQMEDPELMTMEAQSEAFEIGGFDHEMPLSEAENVGYEGDLSAATAAHEALSAAFEAADLALQRSSWEIDETEDEEEAESGEVEIGEAEAFLESLYSREPIFGEATAATVTFSSGAAL